MNTVVELNGEIKEFEKYLDALDYIKSQLDYWNAFNDHEYIDIKVYKTASQIPTIKIDVTDEMKLEDKMA